MAEVISTSQRWLIFSRARCAYLSADCEWKPGLRRAMRFRTQKAAEEYAMNLHDPETETRRVTIVERIRVEKS